MTMNNSRGYIRWITVLTLLYFSFHLHQPKRFLRDQTKSKNKSSGGKTDANSGAPKSKILGKRNPTLRAMEREEDMRRLDRLRDMAENDDIQQEKPRRRQTVSRSQLAVESREKADAERIAYIKKYRKMSEFYTKQIKFETLHIPMIIESSDNSKRFNFSIPYLHGVMGLSLKVREKILGSVMATGSLDLYYIEPHKKERFILSTEEDLRDAVMFYLAKNSAKISRPIQIIAHFDTTKAKVSEGFLKSLEMRDVREKPPKKTEQQKIEQKLKQKADVEKAKVLRKARIKEERLKEKKALMEIEKKRAMEVAKAEQNRLTHATELIPPVPKDYSGISYSPLLRQFEAMSTTGGKRVMLGMFKTREQAWSAICLRANEDGVTAEQLIAMDSGKPASVGNVRLGLGASASGSTSARGVVQSKGRKNPPRPGSADG
ncbi:hypothetical protein AAMO2058_001135500 [Amorphochlora amoebiformis]